MTNSKYINRIRKTLKYPWGFVLDTTFNNDEELMDYVFAYEGSTYSRISDDGNYKEEWSRLSIRFDPPLDRKNPYGDRNSWHDGKWRRVRDRDELRTIMNRLQLIFPKATFRLVTAVPQYSPEQAEVCILVKDGQRKIKKKKATI